MTVGFLAVGLLLAGCSSTKTTGGAAGTAPGLSPEAQAYRVAVETATEDLGALTSGGTPLRITYTHTDPDHGDTTDGTYVTNGDGGLHGVVTETRPGSAPVTTEIVCGSIQSSASSDNCWTRTGDDPFVSSTRPEPAEYMVWVTAANNTTDGDPDSTYTVIGQPGDPDFVATWTSDFTEKTVATGGVKGTLSDTITWRAGLFEKAPDGSPSDTMIEGWSITVERLDGPQPLPLPDFTSP